MFKFIKIGLIAIVSLIVVVFFGYRIIEFRYQKDASAKRIYDTHVIAHLAVDYKNLAGKYPLEHLAEGKDIEVIALITYLP